MKNINMYATLHSYLSTLLLCEKLSIRTLGKSCKHFWYILSYCIPKFLLLLDHKLLVYYGLVCFIFIFLICKNIKYYITSYSFVYWFFLYKFSGGWQVCEELSEVLQQNFFHLWTGFCIWGIKLLISYAKYGTC